MHLVLITQYWEPEQGVVQRRWGWISAALVAAGHHLTVIAPPPHYPTGVLLSDAPEHQPGAVDRSTPGVTVYRCAFRPHGPSISSRIGDQATIMLSQVRTAVRAVRDARRAGTPIDVVCCTVPAVPSAVVAAAVARIVRAPLLVELRDAWPELLDHMAAWRDPAAGRVSPVRRLRQGALSAVLLAGGRALRTVLRSADAVVTTTESLAELKKRDGCQVVVTVKNRPPRSFPDCTGAALRTDGPLRVLYAGTVGRAQGLHNAISALADARAAGTDVAMRVVGGGAHLERVREHAATLGVPVEFYGRVPFDQVVEHYRWADTVLVHLQSWEPMEYTIPSKLFEAIQAKKHVTGCVAGEAAEIIRNTGAGDVVPPMDRLALAEFWQELAADRSRLQVSSTDEWTRHYADTSASDAAAAALWIATAEKIARR